MKMRRSAKPRRKLVRNSSKYGLGSPIAFRLLLQNFENHPALPNPQLKRIEKLVPQIADIFESSLSRDLISISAHSSDLTTSSIVKRSMRDLLLNAINEKVRGKLFSFSIIFSLIDCIDPYFADASKIGHSAAFKVFQDTVIHQTAYRNAVAAHYLDRKMGKDGSKRVQFLKKLKKIGEPKFHDKIPPGNSVHQISIITSGYSTKSDLLLNEKLVRLLKSSLTMEEFLRALLFMN